MILANSPLALLVAAVGGVAIGFVLMLVWGALNTRKAKKNIPRILRHMLERGGSSNVNQLSFDLDLSRLTVSSAILELEESKDVHVDPPWEKMLGLYRPYVLTARGQARAEEYAKSQ